MSFLISAFRGHLGLPGRIDLDAVVELDGQRMLDDRSVVAHERAMHARLAKQGRQGGPIIDFGGQRVPPLPEGTVERSQSRAINKHLVEDDRLRGQSVEGGRLDPGVAVGPQEPAVQAIDDQADGVHCA